MIMTSAVGTTLKESNISPEEKNAVYEKVGITLKKINEVKLEGYGPLRVEKGELIGKFSTWKEYYESQKEYDLRSLNYCVENNYVTLEEAEKIKNIYNEIRSIDFGKASLLHKDLHSVHFFLQGKDISGVIDLGALMAGDPRYDAAMSMVFQSPEQQEYFKSGYGDIADDQLVNKYMITIFIRKIYFRTRQEIKGNVDILLLPLKVSLEKI